MTRRPTLRGAQVTNAAGIVEFRTVYPAGTGGRAVHIHTKVHLSQTRVLTSQLYFDRPVTATVYRSTPTAPRPAGPGNAADVVVRAGRGASPMLTLSPEGEGYLGWDARRDGRLNRTGERALVAGEERGGALLGRTVRAPGRTTARWGRRPPERPAGDSGPPRHPRRPRRPRPSPGDGERDKARNGWSDGGLSEKRLSVRGWGRRWLPGGRLSHGGPLTGKRVHHAGISRPPICRRL